MTTMTFDHAIERDAPVPTWFGVGGRADALAHPRSADELRDLLLAFAHEPIRVLGDGANLLVDDDGVDGLVLDLRALRTVTPLDNAPGNSGGEVLVFAQAGANLPAMITESVRMGLAGIETLAGIPASLGGALVMNAGGAFGQIADVVKDVHALTRGGELLVIPREQINFSYRHSGLNHLIVTGATLRLQRVGEDAQPALRQKLKDVMAYKKNSQPMADKSAGCVFKNPLWNPAIGAHVDAGQKNGWRSGQRVSAGMMIDRAGCKGERIGGAQVSPVHANFVVTHEGCSARDVQSLMERVQQRVMEQFGVRLEPEIAVWRRG